MAPKAVTPPTSASTTGAGRGSRPPAVAPGDRATVAAVTARVR